MSGQISRTGNTGTQRVTKKELEYKRDKYREKVRGIFRFHEVPGGSMSFIYREFAGDPVEKYEMVDGEIYTVPLGVAKHLNNNCWYPVHAYAQDEDGKSSVKVGQKVKRCSFQSLDFVDIESSADKKIITVEKI